jgi:hypothetical protein
MSDGYFPLDLSEVPMNLLGRSLNDCVDDLIIRIGNIKANIILVKANVYDCCYKKLHQKGYNVIDKRIAFPSSGQQTNFRTVFSEAIELINK